MLGLEEKKEILDGKDACNVRKALVRSLKGTPNKQEIAAQQAFDEAREKYPTKWNLNFSL